jgi:ribosome recycling factor
MSRNPVLSRKERTERRALLQASELEKGLESAVEKSTRSVQEKLDKLLKRQEKEIMDANA